MPESRAGRPRSEPARLAVLAAARDLVLSEGYERVSLVQIAATAGVGRQTIYRWWRSKEALLADAVLTETLPLDAELPPHTGDLAADLRGWVQSSIDRIADSDAAALYRALLAASALDPAATARMNDAFAAPLRAAVHASFHATGRGRHADVAADVFIGAMLNALVTRDDAARRRIADVVDVVVRGTAG
ncbi:helix-turn-helix domain-containing protein [Microbacterium sp. NPDC089189]|uniref:TetR/AcrR family transcriptional regulator n=1 Tax=Microbacterium sp. NPDC089189 TaxID=3154972 RepID=UPI0034138D5D